MKNDIDYEVINLLKLLLDLYRKRINKTSERPEIIFVDYTLVKIIYPLLEE